MDVSCEQKAIKDFGKWLIRKMAVLANQDPSITSRSDKMAAINTVDLLICLYVKEVLATREFNELS